MTEAEDQRTQSLLPSPQSGSALTRLAAELDTTEPMGSRTRLCRFEDCAAIIAAIEADCQPMTPDEAKGFAQRLLARYPGMRPHDALFYTTEMVAVFAAYPRSIGHRVIDPVKGALAESKYMPSVPEVNRALRAEVQRRERIKANARAHIIEAKRREAARREALEIAARPDDATRKAQAEALVARFRAMNAQGAA